MAPDERGRAAGATPDDDNDGASQRTPPPPNVLDLGNGEAWCIGTAAGLRAAAAWLEQTYPEHSSDPPTGTAGGTVILNMSNYRVRQVLALGDMPERQLRFLIALATWMNDDTRTVRVGFEQLIEDTGKSHNTVRNARRELESAEKLASLRGDGRGHVTLWTVLCLPEKGTNEVDPLNGEPKGTNEVGTFTSVDNSRKGTNHGPERVPTEGAKGYQSERADQQEPERGLNRRAKPSNPSAHSRAQAYDDPLFAGFWDAYPRHEGKRHAWRAWQAALRRGADPAAVTAAAKQYAAERHGQDPRYTRHPATWLNGDCWEDEAPALPTGPVEVEYTGWMG